MFAKSIPVNSLWQRVALTIAVVLAVGLISSNGQVLASEPFESPLGSQSTTLPKSSPGCLMITRAAATVSTTGTRHMMTATASNGLGLGHGG